MYGVLARSVLRLGLVVLACSTTGWVRAHTCTQDLVHKHSYRNPIPGSSTRHLEVSSAYAPAVWVDAETNHTHQCMDSHGHLGLDVINYSYPENVSDYGAVSLANARAGCNYPDYDPPCAKVKNVSCGKSHSNLSSCTLQAPPTNGWIVEFIAEDISADSTGERIDYDKPPQTHTMTTSELVIPIVIRDDTLVEITERFKFRLEVTDNRNMNRGFGVDTSLVSSLGQVTILDTDQTTVDLEFSDGAHRSYMLREVGASTFPIELDLRIGRAIKIAESRGPVNSEIRIGPNLIEHGHSFVVKTDLSGNAYYVNDESLRFTADLKVHLQCPRGNNDFPKKPIGDYVPGDESKCGISSLGVSDRDYVEYGETEWIAPLQTVRSVSVALKDDNLPERYTTLEMTRYSSEVVYVDLLRNGVQSDVLSGNSTIGVHIIDDDPAFIPSNQAEVYGESDDIRIPVSLAYKIPVGSLLAWKWAEQGDPVVIEQGVVAISPDETRGYVQIPGGFRDPGKNYELELALHQEQGALRLHATPTPMVTGEPEWFEPVLREGEHRLAKRVTISDFEYTDLNPIVNVYEGELEYKAGGVELNLHLDRMSRHYFSVDYKATVGSSSMASTLYFQPGSRGHTIRYVGSEEDLVGSRIELLLNNTKKPNGDAIGHIRDSNENIGREANYGFSVVNDILPVDDPSENDDPPPNEPCDIAVPSRSSGDNRQLIYCEVPKHSGSMGEGKMCPIVPSSAGGAGAGCWYWNDDQNAKQVFWVRGCAPAGESCGYNAGSDLFRCDC